MGCLLLVPCWGWRPRSRKGDKKNLGESAGGGGGEVAAGESGGAAGSGERPKRRRKKQEQICLARCTLKAKPESKFCGIHTHPQQTQNVEGALAVVPREEAPVFQLQQTNLDIGMFLLRLPIQEIAKVFAFWQSQQGPPLKICSERPSLYQLFSHPLALFFESRKVPVLKNGSRRCVVLFMQQV